MRYALLASFEVRSPPIQGLPFWDNWLPLPWPWAAEREAACTGQLQEGEPEERPRTVSNRGGTRDMAKHSTPRPGCDAPCSPGRGGEASSLTPKHGNEYNKGSAWTFSWDHLHLYFKDSSSARNSLSHSWTHSLEPKATLTEGDGMFMEKATLQRCEAALLLAWRDLGTRPDPPPPPAGGVILGNARIFSALPQSRRDDSKLYFTGLGKKEITWCSESSWHNYCHVLLVKHSTLLFIAMNRTRDYEQNSFLCIRTFWNVILL